MFTYPIKRILKIALIRAYSDSFSMDIRNDSTPEVFGSFKRFLKVLLLICRYEKGCG